MAKFLLLGGQHIESEKDKTQKDGFKRSESGTRVQKVYNADRSGAGNVVESDVDLVARFGEDKFRKLHPGDIVPEARTSGPDFDKMTVEQLKQHAEAQEIDLGKAETKAEILAVLKPKK